MMMGHAKSMHMITFCLLIIGGLNWLAFGLFEVEVGTYIGGMTSMAAKVVYVLVGLAAIYEVAMHKHNCKKCTEGKTMPPATNM